MKCAQKRLLQGTTLFLDTCTAHCGAMTFHAVFAGVIMAYGFFCVLAFYVVQDFEPPPTFSLLSETCGPQASICGDMKIYERQSCVNIKSSSLVQIVSLKVFTVIQARHAFTTVTSIIRNMADSSQEFSYPFVVPDSSRVSGFTLRKRGLKFESKPIKKEDVRVYPPLHSTGSSVKGATKVVIHLTLDPKADVTLNVTYEELIDRTLSKYTNKVYLNPGQIVPELRVDIRINEVKSFSYVEVKPFTNDVYTANKNATKAHLAEDQVKVSFQLSESEQKELAASFKDSSTSGVNGYLAVTYDLPRDNSSGDVIVNGNNFIHYFSPTVLTPYSKHVIFVIDNSPSMKHDHAKQFQKAMATVLRQLETDRDRFTIIECLNGPKIWNISQEYTDKCHSHPRSDNWKLENQLKHWDFTNGTETRTKECLLRALQCALEQFEEKVDLDPVLLFLTDNQPSNNTEEILSRIEADNSLNTSIFTLAFGTDANFTFLNTLSTNTGGKAFIYDPAILLDFYKTIPTPLLKNVSVTYDGTHIVDLTRSQFDHYSQGSELRISGRFKAGLNRELKGTVTAIGADRKTVSYPIQSVMAQMDWKWINVNGWEATERFWAFMRLTQLLGDTASPGPANVSTSRFQRGRKNSAPGTLTKEEATALAMKYSFVSPTSCLKIPSEGKSGTY